MPNPASASAQRDEQQQPYFPYTDHDSKRRPSASSPSLSSSLDIPQRPPPTPRQPSTVRSSLLQPRVAVALGLSARWHPFLFVCRLLSCIPAVWYGLPVALGLLAQAHLWYIVETGMSSCSEDSLCLAGLSWLRERTLGGGVGVDGSGLLGGGRGGMEGFERRLRVTETALGICWVRCRSFVWCWSGTGGGRWVDDGDLSGCMDGRRTASELSVDWLVLL